MGNHNLNINCDNNNFKQKIEKQLTYYTSYDSELRGRVNVEYRPRTGKITVNIIGYEAIINTKEEADAVKEVAETILFECGNAQNAGKQRNTRQMCGEPGKTAADIGRKKSDIEALQCYDLWEILGKSGLSLSQYGERQSSEILSFDGNRSKYLTNFATSGHASDSFKPKVSNANWDSKGGGTITVDLRASKGGSVTSLNSENMYTFTAINGLNNFNLQKMLNKFVPGDTSWNTYVTFVADKKPLSVKHNLLFYCTMLDLAIKGWNASEQPRLKKEIIIHGVASPLSVEQKLPNDKTVEMKTRLTSAHYPNNSKQLSELQAICEKMLINYRA